MCIKGSLSTGENGLSSMRSSSTQRLDVNLVIVNAEMTDDMNLERVNKSTKGHKKGRSAFYLCTAHMGFCYESVNEGSVFGCKQAVASGFCHRKQRALENSALS
ncbi:hypothetical protein Tco_1428953 [Tanacetum coccineum]